MKITLKDGSSKEYSEAKSVYEIAKDISEGLARAACAGEVDGEIVDLRTVLDKDCTLNIITASDEEGLRVIRHTASHVLAQAVKNLFPDAKITIGPAIDDGFYYDFDSQPFSREDLDALEAEMKKIIKQGHLLLIKFTCGFATIRLMPLVCQPRCLCNSLLMTCKCRKRCKLC